MTEYQERIDGLLAACDKRQLAVMLLEARADERALRAQLAEARELLDVLEYRPDDWSLVSTIDINEWLARCDTLLTALAGEEKE